MNEPLVSIVLPVYNGSRHFDRAVENCINQTYPAWELIIVDDASTDGTPLRIVHYEAIDRRIRSVRHERNRKLPAALNSGFSRARGDYLTWTSDDNYYRPQAIAEMVKLLESNRRTGMTYSDYTVIDEQDRPLHRVRVGEPEDLGLRNCIGACFLYRRAVLNKVGRYKEDMFLAEDYDFWLRVSAYCPIEPLHEDLYFYRVHANSLTVTHEESVLARTEQVLKANLPLMHRSNRVMRANAGLHLARLAQLRNDPAAGRRYLADAIVRSPMRVVRQVVGLTADGLLGRSAAGLIGPVYRMLQNRRHVRRRLAAESSLDAGT